MQPSALLPALLPDMHRVLIIKTSSMGDVVHNLPLIGDILHAVPGASIDWVAEEAYADIPRLHPGVARVIPVALRRWRKSWLSVAVRRERRAFHAELRRDAYDLVLDTQGLLKSAWIARSARLAPAGARAGFGFASVREKAASLFYQRRYDVDMSLHAVERLRSLAGQALGYVPRGLPDFGLRAAPADFTWLGAGKCPDYAVLLFATSRAEKSWPIRSWIALGRHLLQGGIVPVLTWGSAAEQEVAHELAEAMSGSGMSRAIVAPRLTLAEAASLLAGARATVGVDTGLTHLAAALQANTVALFGATPRWRFAPYWTPRAVSLGENGRQASVDEVMAALAQLEVTASVSAA